MIEENDIPLWLLLWGRAVETVLYTAYFLFISAIALSIDLSLHWLESQIWVEHLHPSKVILWIVELMAYTLAGVDCFLFLRRILFQPVASFLLKALHFGGEEDDDGEA